MPVRCGRLHGAAPAGTQPVPLHVYLIVFARTINRVRHRPLATNIYFLCGGGGGGGGGGKTQLLPRIRHCIWFEAGGGELGHGEDKNGLSMRQSKQ